MNAPNWDAVRTEGQKAIDTERARYGQELSERLDGVTGSLKVRGHGAVGPSQMSVYLSDRNWKETLFGNVCKEIAVTEKYPLHEQELNVLTDFIDRQRQLENDWKDAVDLAEAGHWERTLERVRSFPTQLARDLERALVRNRLFSGEVASKQPTCPSGIGEAVHQYFLEAVAKTTGTWFRAGTLGNKYDRTTRTDWLNAMTKAHFLEHNNRSGSAREYRKLSTSRNSPQN